jgi:hypothetical protein
MRAQRPFFSNNKNKTRNSHSRDVGWMMMTFGVGETLICRGTCMRKKKTRQCWMLENFL